MRGLKPNGYFLAPILALIISAGVGVPLFAQDAPALPADPLAPVTGSQQAEPVAPPAETEPPVAEEVAEKVNPVGEPGSFEAPEEESVPEVVQPRPDAEPIANPVGEERLKKAEEKVDPTLKIVINVPSRTLWLVEERKFSDGSTSELITDWFPVGLGRSQFRTPLGEFKVLRKVKNPAWENPYLGPGAQRVKPGTSNPLGTRWIGFHRVNGGEYGMHGTPSVHSVGRFSSHGCVRLQIKDAEKLFEIVDVNTPVDVIYDLALIRPDEEANVINLVVYPDYYRKGFPSTDAMVSKIKQRFPQAVVDRAKVQQALKSQSQKPFTVGTLKPAASTAVEASPPSL